MKRNILKIIPLITCIVLIICCSFSVAAVQGTGSEQKTASAMSYEEFKALTDEQQIEVFSSMTGPEIYTLVKNSDENWPVTNYDLISPDNAKETIVLFNNDGDLHFNLDWPCYGGFLPETIASMGEMTGKADVSRDGGDGGYSMSYGKNEDAVIPMIHSAVFLSHQPPFGRGSWMWISIIKWRSLSPMGKVKKTVRQR